MSDETPTSPPPPPAPDGAATPDATVEQPAAPEAAPASGGGNGKKVALGIGAVVAVAAVGGGAYAWTQLSGGGTQPHDVLPADTIAYVRLDLDPSASQKIDLFRLARRVPELSQELGIKDEGDDLRKIVLENALQGCDDVDYAKDVEPWLGERVGLGVGPNLQDEEESLRVAVQVTDEKAAKAGIGKLFACSDEEFGVGFLDGYAIVTPTQKSADAAVKAASTKSLADDDDFARDQDVLDEQGVLSGWVDVKGSVAAIQEAGIDDALGPDAAQLETVADETSSLAFALSASSTSLTLDAVAHEGDKPTTLPKVRGLGALPEDTVVGLTVPGGGKAVEENWDEIKAGLGDLLSLRDVFTVPGQGLSGSADPFAEGAQPEFDAEAYAADPEGYEEEYLAQLQQQAAPPAASSADVDATIEEVEKTLDVTLPDDLVTLLGDAFSVYVGRDGLEDIAGPQGPADPSDVAVGLVTEGDEKKAADLADRLTTSLQRLAGVELATSEGDDAVSIATSPRVAKELVEDGDLAGTDLYSSVIDGDGDGGGLFVDVGAILDAVAKAEPDMEQDDVFTSLRNIAAVGLSNTHPQDGYIGLSASVAFTERKQ
ncbi:MAG: DUF3352 domain-containing protein [Propionibacteriales bacterium]|nr:DUF3352 domain-containing protein [Propionibacteriales bacterium]